MTSKLPTIAVPLIKDPTMATALERALAPFNGKSLERRQQALVQTHASGVIGTTEQLIATYLTAMDKADPKGARDD